MTLTQVSDRNMVRTLAATVLALLLATSIASGGQNVVVVLDDSGSMRDRMRQGRQVRKIDAAKQALLAVLAKLPSDSSVGVVVLNGGRDPWVMPLGPVDQSRLQSAVAKIRASGSTPLGAFMKVGADALLELRDRERYGTFKLLIVTDGEAGDPDLVQAYLPDVIARGITVDVIGVDMRQDHSLATQVNTYRRADDPSSLSQAISEVVLGESTSAAGDAGESDFELLAGFPDDMAVAALSALSQVGNEPISGVDSGTYGVGGGQGSTARPTTLPARPGVGVRWISFLTGACGFGCFSVMIIVVLVFTLFSRKR